MRKSCTPKFFLFLLAGVIFSCAAAPRTTHAETLDDQTIHKIYATLETDIRDKAKIKQHMQERLADNYTLTLNQNVIVNGLPPQISKSTLSKAETLANTLKGYDSMSIETGKYDIYDIRYSQDRKIAYVRQTVTLNGTLVSPANVPSNASASHFKDVEKCQEALTLADEKIMFLQTACDSQMFVTQ